MNEITKQLARDFTKEVFNVLKEQPGLKLFEAINIAAQRPAPRLYITSYNHVQRHIKHLHKGKELHIRNTNKVAMYQELYRRYAANTTIEANHKIDIWLLYKVSELPAPSYYHTPQYLRTLFYKHQNKVI